MQPRLQPDRGRCVPIGLYHSKDPRPMPATAQIIYQPYVAGPRGTLRPGTPVACRTPEEGIRRAERALAGGSILGARVVRVHHDEAADEFGPPEYLGDFGQVPEET